MKYVLGKAFTNIMKKVHVPVICFYDIGGSNTQVVIPNIPNLSLFVSFFSSS